MRPLVPFAGLVLMMSCNMGGKVGSPPEFPFPVLLPSAVVTQGSVRYDKQAMHGFPVQGGIEVVSGKRWMGHVRVPGYDARDRAFMATLERSLAVAARGCRCLYSSPPRART